MSNTEHVGNYDVHLTDNQMFHQLITRLDRVIELLEKIQLSQLSSGVVYKRDYESPRDATGYLTQPSTSTGDA